MTDWMREAMDAARPALDAEMHRIKESELACRYCKAAKTRKQDQKATCKDHALAYHLAYVTSPASETYWAS